MHKGRHSGAERCLLASLDFGRFLLEIALGFSGSSGLQKSCTMSKIVKFITGEVLNLAVGYLAGLIASNLVSRYFVKKGLVNLWGIAAKKEALSKDAYEWLMFVSSYLLGLLVMLAVSQLMERLRKE